MSLLIVRAPCSRPAARAFTLVELLVVIGIIGILVALIVPAVQVVRESARLRQCTNHVRQMALAAVQHENVLGMFPVDTGGYDTTGDADLGAGDVPVVTPDYPNGSLQRGGWQYNILPYMEQLPLHQLGAGLSGAAKRLEANKRVAVVVAAYVCPSRSDPRIPASGGFSNSGSSGWPGFVTRSDFAGSRGSGGKGMLAPSPGRLDWQIRDGLSNVFFCGHRYLNPLEYNAVGVPCNNAGWSVGADWDNTAGTHSDGPEWGAPNLSTSGDPPARNFNPLQDTPDEPSCGRFPAGAPWTWGHPQGGRFGGPHAVLPMAMADGSVHGIAYGISVVVFEQLGKVDDGGSAGDFGP